MCFTAYNRGSFIGAAAFLRFRLLCCERFSVPVSPSSLLLCEASNVVDEMACFLSFTFKKVIIPTQKIVLALS